MARDPSLLPEEMRKREDDAQSTNGKAGGVFHIPELLKKQAKSVVSAVSTVEAEQKVAVEQKQEAAPRPPVVKQKEKDDPRVEKVEKQQDKKAARAVSTAKARESGAPKLHIPSIGKRALRGITLIPDELRKRPIHPKWPQIVAIIGLALVVPLIGVPWMLLQSRVEIEQATTNALESQRSMLIAKISDAERDVDAFRATSRRAVALDELLNQHGSWERFFEYIEDMTIPGVRYESLTADAGGSVMLPTSAPNMRTAAAQLSTWKEAEEVQDFNASGISTTIDEFGVARQARFDLRLSVNPSLFTAIPEESIPASVEGAGE
ncbi:MAG: hypothetical protein ABIG71_02525 [Candidatus Uhrbacteria bacterium]